MPYNVHRYPHNSPITILHVNFNTTCGDGIRKNQCSLKFCMLTIMYSPNPNMNICNGASLFVTVERTEYTHVIHSCQNNSIHAKNSKSSCLLKDTMMGGSVNPLFYWNVTILKGS